MRWLDPTPVTCSQCYHQSHIPLSDLRALQATCPHCGFSFAHIGQGMLDTELRFRREVSPFIVGYDLCENFGWDTLDQELNHVPTLDYLALVITRHVLYPNDPEIVITHPTLEVAQLISNQAHDSRYSFLLNEEGSELIRTCLERA